MKMPTTEEDDDINNNKVIVAAPMVRGSELAYRMLLRSHGIVSLCYTPMMRANKILEAIRYHRHCDDDRNGISPNNDNNNKTTNSTTTTTLHEDCHLFLNDSCSEDHPLIVQLCGGNPQILHEATKVVVTYFSEQYQNPLYGIDLNLGCPQSCAKDGGFGAFLDPTRAVGCVRAMKEALLTITNKGCSSKDNNNNNNVKLSCKIRLLDTTTQDTIQFALQLQNAGCDCLTVHCRRKESKHDGDADLQAGREIVEALDIPVWINGAIISNKQDVQKTLQLTKAPKIMIARAFLINHRLFLKDSHHHHHQLCPSPPSDPALLAAEYLEYCQQYPPPSPLYIQKHFRWMFREKLQHNITDCEDWRFRLWTFLVRPYLQTIQQFRQVIVLYITHKNNDGDEEERIMLPESLRDVPTPVTFSAIRHQRDIHDDEDDDQQDGPLFDLFGSSSS